MEPAWTIEAVPMPDWVAPPVLSLEDEERVPRPLGAHWEFSIPDRMRDRYESLFQKREDERQHYKDIKEHAERHLTREDAREMSTTRYEIKEASRQLGELAGEAYVTDRFPGATREYPPPGAPSRSGDFDQVWKAKDASGNDLWIVVEAKGGTAGLTDGRDLSDGTRAKQGSSAYFDRIVEIMGGTQDGARVALQLENARLEGSVRYLEVRAPIGQEDGVPALKEPTVREFDLSRPR